MNASPSADARKLTVIYTKKLYNTVHDETFLLKCYKNRCLLKIVLLWLHVVPKERLYHSHVTAFRKCITTNGVQHKGFHQIRLLLHHHEWLANISVWVQSASVRCYKPRRYTVRRKTTEPQQIISTTFWYSITGNLDVFRYQVVTTPPTKGFHQSN